MVLIFVGIAYAGYEYYSFQSEDVPRMEAQRKEADALLETKQTELKRLQDFSRNIEQVKIELRELNLQLEAALEYMPRTFNLSGLLRKLTMLAQNSGLELFSFKPAGTEEKVEGMFYSTISIEFDLRGTFTQILVFFDQVSRLKRIINADEVRMALDAGTQEGTKAATRTGSVVLNTVARVKTFRFSE